MLWNDNLSLNNKTKIPSLNNKFFIFENIWNYSIIIRFDLENVDIKNLYCILQSYLWNKNIRVLKIYTGFISKDNKKILSYSNIFLVKKMNLIYFIDWWENICKHDSFYNLEENKEIYGIILCFSKSSIISFIEKENIRLENIKDITPIYPWKEQIVNHLNFLE